MGGGKGGGSAPQAPDPYKTADAQAQAFVKAAKESSALNNLNQYMPYGSVTYLRDAEGVPYAQQVNLTPEAQSAFNAQQALQANLSGAAANLASQIPSGPFTLPGNLPPVTTGLDMTGAPDYVGGINTSNLPNLPGTNDFSADRDATSNAVYQRALSLMQPQLDQQTRQTQQMLSDRGLPITGEAYTNEMNRLQSSQNDTLTRLAEDAVTQGAAEQSRLFGLDLTARQQGIGEQLQNAQVAQQARSGIIGEELQNAQLAGQARSGITNEALMQYNAPIQQIASLLGTSPQTPAPQGGNYFQSAVQAPNLEGDVYNSYNAQMQAWQAQQAQQNSLWGGIGSILGSVGSAILSDKKKKHRIRKSGPVLKRIEKLPVRSWQYKPGIDDGSRHIGPMAQDVHGAFGIGDGHMIPTVDAFGLSIKAIQELSRKVSALESRNARRVA